MSFVSIVGNEKFISVFSDGLVVNLETGEELDQNYQKFAKISDKQFVAFAGNQGGGEAIKKTLPFSDTPYEIEGVSKVIHKRILDEIPYESAKMLVAIGGLNPLTGKLEFFAFSNNPNVDFQIFKPVGDQAAFTFLCNFKSGKVEELEETLATLLEQNGFSVTEAQRRLNTFVSERDETVNDITFNLIITATS